VFHVDYERGEHSRGGLESSAMLARLVRWL
jgi:hypothetical protein